MQTILVIIGKKYSIWSSAYQKLELITIILKQTKYLVYVLKYFCLMCEFYSNKYCNRRWKFVVAL